MKTETESEPYNQSLSLKPSLDVENRENRTKINEQEKSQEEFISENEDESDKEDQENQIDDNDLFGYKSQIENLIFEEKIKKLKEIRLNENTDRSYLDTGALYIPPLAAEAYGSKGVLDLLKLILSHTGIEEQESNKENIEEQKYEDDKEKRGDRSEGSSLYTKKKWRLLALLGDTGSGKSVFTRHLEKGLW